MDASAECTVAQPSRRCCSKQDLALGLLLLVAVVAVFCRTLNYDFLNWDDQEYIHRNAWLLNLSWQNVAGVFTHSYFANYHPLTMLSYMVDFQFFGYHPAGYRAVNIALHALASVALYGLMRSLCVRPAMASLTVLLFALHPLRIESVVWISERKDVLCALFYIGAFWAWVVAGKKESGAKWIALAVGLFALALMSKAMAVSFPIVVIAHDALLNRERMMRRVPVYTAMLALSALFVVLNTHAQSEALAVDVPLSARASVAAYAPWFYAWKTVWPFWVSPFYPYEARPTRHVIAAVWGAMVCVAALWVVVYTWKRQPWLAFGLLSAGVILGPVSGIVAFGGAFAADRYSYLPTAFLFIGLATAFLRDGDTIAKNAKMRRITAIVMLLGICICTVANLMSQPPWRDSTALWERVAALYPDSGKAKLNLGHALMTEAGDAAGEAPPINGDPKVAGPINVYTAMEAGDYAKAEALARALPSPADRFYWLIRVARASHSVVLGSEAARELLALDPPANAEYRANAAMALLDAGNEQNAISVMEGIDVPTRIGAFVWGRIAQASLARSDAETAIEQGRKGSRIFPAEGESAKAVADALLSLGRTDEALAVLRRALRHPIIGDLVRLDLQKRVAMIAVQRGDVETANDIARETFGQFDDDDSRPADERAARLSFAANLVSEIGTPAARQIGITLYDRAIELAPSKAENYSALAFEHLKLNDLGKAIEALRAGLEAVPGDAELTENLALLEKARAGATP